MLLRSAVVLGPCSRATAFSGLRRAGTNFEPAVVPALPCRGYSAYDHEPVGFALPGEDRGARRPKGRGRDSFYRGLDSRSPWDRDPDDKTLSTEEYRQWNETMGTLFRGISAKSLEQCKAGIEIANAAGATANTRTWNSVLRIYVTNNATPEEIDDVLKLFTPTAYSYAQVAEHALKLGLFERAAQFVDRTCDKMGKPDAMMLSRVFVAVVKASPAPNDPHVGRLVQSFWQKFAGARLDKDSFYALNDTIRDLEVEQVGPFLELLEGAGIRPSKIALQTAMYRYGHNGDLVRARMYFNRIGERGWTYDNMIYGHFMTVLLNRKNYSEVLELELDMRRRGIQHTSVTLVLAMRSAGYDKESTRVGELMDVYFTLKDVENEDRVFNAAIEASARSGDFRRLQIYLTEMQQLGIRPTDYTAFLMVVQVPVLHHALYGATARRLLGQYGHGRGAKPMERPLETDELAFLQRFVDQLATHQAQFGSAKG
eukprot:TRINITY_DN4804_c0_g1_i1.p1 TRINITY_DN4804_c0_g1~~TRINITY_DN4804_c0_g1_i1.p1  ORF type:complete len:484 (-),score=113.62 TRINITY_DN4804_c0_g1_i1:119-1570(-)